MTKPRWQSCNVMALGPTGPRLWQIQTPQGKAPSGQAVPLEPPAATSPKLIGKDWNELVRPRLNLAWLPPEEVFVRVVQLPRAETPAETLSMLEFQLEKLSPLPAAQVMWTFEIVPAQGLNETQTAVLVVVPRQVIEALLGKLEAQGYFADRIELPFVDQLLGVEINRDCALLFPIQGPDGARFLWVAWWYGGVLRNLSQIHVPEGAEAGAVVAGQLGQTIWGAELEGWLTSPPRYFIVADEAAAAEWTQALSATLGAPIERIPSAGEAALAVMTARRAIQTDPGVRLLPPEHASRYRQLFVDKLWMQSLFGMLACYVFALLLYFGICAFKGYQRDGLLEQEIVQGNAYTNSIKLRDQVRVLQEQINLQFAALNCYLAVATNMPAELTLESLNFDRGTKLMLYGHGGAESANKVYDFVAALKKAQNQSQPIFDTIDGPAVTLKPGGAQISWNLTCNIRRAEVE